MGIQTAGTGLQIAAQNRALTDAAGRTVRRFEQFERDVRQRQRFEELAARGQLANLRSAIQTDAAARGVQPNARRVADAARQAGFASDISAFNAAAAIQQEAQRSGERLAQLDSARRPLGPALLNSLIGEAQQATSLFATLG